jgi:hypothetical protein
MPERIQIFPAAIAAIADPVLLDVTSKIVLPGNATRIRARGLLLRIGQKRPRIRLAASVPHPFAFKMCGRRRDDNSTLILGFLFVAQTSNPSSIRPLHPVSEARR